MKPALYICLLCLLTGMRSNAQKTANNWLFGNKAGITFNTDPPTTIRTSQLSSYEGSASISDGSGHLLFYCDGNRIYNKRNEVMMNGSGLEGNISSTSNCLIIQQPGSLSRYYVFAVSAAGVDYQPFTYNVVDMSKEGGLGAVVQKNVLIKEPIFEKMAAVRHCNKKDAWIVVKQFGTDVYYSYQLTAAGLNMVPVTSHSGYVVAGVQTNAIGSLRFSPDGKKLAAAHGGELNHVEIMDFNSITGTITSSIDFAPNDMTPILSARGVYGIEFSPNNKLLYVTSHNNPAQTIVLYQFDLTASGPGGIVASRQIITQRSDWFAGGLQLGPDRKIYLALWQDSALSVIENPDVYGAGCNFIYNKIPLYRNPVYAYASQSGLPAFVSSDLLPEFADYKFSIIRQDCSSTQVLLKASYSGDIDSIRWNFGDGRESTALSPAHIYSSYGNYTVTMRLFRKGCINELQVFQSEQQLILQQGGTKLPQINAFCGNISVILKPLTSGETYLWNTGETTDSIIVTTPGIYWLKMEANGCISTDTVRVLEKPELKVHLRNDTTVCLEAPVRLQAPQPGMQYLWSNGSTQSSITVTKPGSYWMKFENNTNCLYSDTVKIEEGNCEIYFPAAFTPNGDTRNDLFGLINSTSAKTFELQIYNRNGQLVFQSADQYKKWDGTNNGKKQPAGTYVWVMRFRPLSGLQQMMKGTVLLIR